MIERLLPANVACADTYEADGPPGSLYPEEALLVANSVDKRRHEFAAARACARRAMGDLGLPPAPVLRGHRGMPLWPEGTVGSMTHCDGYRAAALAWSSEIRAVGIDAEPNEPLPPGVWEMISLPSERARLSTGVHDTAVHWGRLLFSAKESVFKTWYPLTRTELDFDEADVTFRSRPGNATEGTFTAELSLTVPGMPTSYEGRWLVDDGFAVTAIVLPADRAA
ncbi:4'-phosphopantetheinyl transferase superfamily protein [Streptomyces sp. NBC_00111]|uniref:4'-phosphopantetheinyl transferase family protein n=1 Tax=unclassified Streptomyces TaxID=2593676 RepID=UPI002E375E6E|nr:4'-phosphopantetheinyl transferase superfamily protein [Streptomyces sp. NBC_01460]